MEVTLVVLGIGVTIAMALLFSSIFAKRYLDRRDTTCGTAMTCIGALATALFCLLIIPVDIYTVSSGILPNGLQGNPGLLSDTSAVLQYIYTGLYIVLCLFAFLLLPFFYFYYEEEDNSGDTRKQACSALKYTLGFLFAFLILLALGIILKTDRSDSADSIIARLAEGFTVADSILYFVVGTLTVLGMLFFMFYGAYGLAVMPAFMFRPIDNSDPGYVRIGKTNRGRGGARGSASAATHKERIRFLKSKYDLSDRVWTKKDKEELNRHERAMKRIRVMKRRHEEVGVTPPGSAAGNPNACADKCWNCLLPFRLAFGVIFFLLSWFIIVSLLLATIDRLLHSECGPACGYILETATIPNPMDIALRFFSNIFPVDYILFTVLMMYLFLASLFGIVELGVWFLWVSMFKMNVTETPSNGMCMAIWIASFMVLSLSQQAYNLMPYYTTYGDQFLVVNGTHVDCTIDTMTDDQCVMTRVASYLLTQNSQLPFLGVATFYLNLGFQCLFFAFSVYAACICRTPRTSTSTDTFNHV